MSEYVLTALLLIAKLLKHKTHGERLQTIKHLIEYNLPLADISEASARRENIRYIEVKARARSGAIRLSANEWKKAHHFDDKFWLYIVTEAASDVPQLHRIQNPVAKLRVGEDIFATGFIIHEDAWRQWGASTPEERKR